MAATIARRPQSITVRMPKARRLARRVGVATARAAMSEKHTLAAVGTAAVFGYMTRAGGTTLPHITSLGQAGTWGLALWAVGRFTKNNTAQHMATGLLAVQAHQFGAGATTTSGMAGDAGTVMGGIL